MTATRPPRLQHVSLPIRDGAQPAVRAFYAGVLGFAEKAVPAAIAHYGFVWFAAGPGDLELHFIPDPDGAVRGEERHICLEVGDLDGVRGRLAAVGREPFETFPVPGRRRFFCRDPFGLLLEFYTPTPPADAPA